MIVHLAFLGLILLKVVKILLGDQKYRKVKEVKEDCLIAGDFNAHHTSWNCEYIDSNREYLLSAMFDKRYICINIHTKSRLNFDNQQVSNLDLIFANQ